ncbi:Presilphiperfolan-8-beta-ol synthase [Whalleya microplaca]|nr:Presilphiperfolan-8-beta-ol synthase [Whalleya microplaca]
MVDTVNYASQGTSPSLKSNPKEKQIYIPDLFSSIMSVKPTVNPNYFHVKSKGDAWITRVIQADEKWAQKNSKADMAYMASIWAPTCDEEALRVMLILFDDQFDEGHLSNDLSAAQEELDVHLGIMENTQPRFKPEESPIRYCRKNDAVIASTAITPDIFPRQIRFPDDIGPSEQDLQHHWKEMHRRFFDGLLVQIKVTQDKRTLTRDVQEFLDMRRGTIAVYPVIALTGYAQGIELSPKILEHASLQECMCVSADLALLVNDILSYKKDLALGVDQNLIMLLKAKGLSTQQAVDRMGTMLDDCYKRWYTALANMPAWGEKIDHKVLQFVDVCRNVALGNLYWSFKTGRYLGADGDKVHETRVMNLSY